MAEPAGLTAYCHPGDAGVVRLYAGLWGLLLGREVAVEATPSLEPGHALLVDRAALEATLAEGLREEARRWLDEELGRWEREYRDRLLGDYRRGLLVQSPSSAIRLVTTAL